MFRQSSAAAIAAIVWLACSAPPVTGQGKGDFVFRGGLESLTFTGESSALLRLKVAGFDAEVRVTDTARIRSASGQALSLLELTVGSLLEVTADWIDGSFTASVLTVPEYEQVGVVGVIDVLLPERLVISGTEFLLDENSASMAGHLAGGQMAAVLGAVAWNGSLTANQIVSQEQFWIFGRITKKDDAEKTITIASRVIAVGESTRILAADKTFLKLADLAVGAAVSVVGKTSSGRLTADEVRIVETNNRVEIRGQVISSTADSITIKSLDTPFVIRKDAKTEVVGSITPGTTVSITATLQPDGLLLAQRIVSQAGTNDGKPGETGFSGVLEKVEAATGVLVVQGVTVKLASGAVIRAGDKEVRISELKPGDKVKVTGTKQTDGTFLATRIELMGGPPVTTAITGFDGAIERIATDGKTIVVGGVTVVISDKTMIQAGDKAIRVADLKVGDKVKIVGSKQGDGTFLAQQIAVIPATPVPPTGWFEGTIERIATDGKTIVAGGVKVAVSDKTIIQAADKTIRIGDLKVGDKVKVVGSKLDDGTFLAQQIVVIPVTPAPVTTSFAGVIDRIAADSKSLVVSGVLVRITEKTAIQSGSGTIKFTDLKAGDKVKVSGEKQPDSSYNALLIYVTTPAPPK